MNDSIKIYRKLLDWEWIDCPEMVGLWINLLLRVNTKDEKWHGLTIKRGQMKTSLTELAEMSGLSRQTLRTCLQRLESTQEITYSPTQRYSIITVCKYDYYQCADDVCQHDCQHDDQQTANTLPTQSTPIPYSPSSKGKHIERKEIYPLKGVKEKKAKTTAGAAPQPQSEEFRKFNEWINRKAALVAQMKEPFSEEQFRKISNDFEAALVRDVLEAMSNTPRLCKDYISAYKTCRAWCKRRIDNLAAGKAPAPVIRNANTNNNSVNALWGR